MKPPLISCVVPVFNGERCLSETLDSILSESYHPLEIIVADDGSTDGTSASVRDMGIVFDTCFSLTNASASPTCKLFWIPELKEEAERFCPRQRRRRLVETFTVENIINAEGGLLC